MDVFSMFFCDVYANSVYQQEVRGSVNYLPTG